MYAQAGDFRVSRGPPTVPLTQILRNAVFFKFQNPRKARTLCIGNFTLEEVGKVSYLVYH